MPEVMRSAALATYQVMADHFNGVGYTPSLKRDPEVDLDIAHQLDLIEE